MKLHIGCGNIKLKGYVNIDIRETKATDKVMDARNLEYPSGSVNEIFSSHMLEHLNKADGIKFIQECHRILKDKGLLRIECPAVDFLIEDCWKPNLDHNQFINILYGIQRFPEDCHRYGYTSVTLVEFLKEYGFDVYALERGRSSKPNSKNGVKVWATKTNSQK